MQVQGVDFLQKYLLSLEQNPPNLLYKGELDTTQGSQSGKLDASANLLSIKNQLQARYLLGRYYMRNDMLNEADAALQTGELKPPFHSSQSDGFYNQIVQLRAKLAKKLTDVH